MKFSEKLLESIEKYSTLKKQLNKGGNMKLSFECPDEWETPILEAAHEDHHNSKSLVIRKALSFFLFSGYRNVEKMQAESKVEKAPHGKPSQRI